MLPPRLLSKALALTLAISAFPTDYVKGSPGHGKPEPIKLLPQIPSLDVLPQPKRLEGRVGESLILRPKVNALGYATDAPNPPETVTYVQPDSLAWKAGLANGDKILSRAARKPYAALIVMRGGKKYLCMIDLRAAAPAQAPSAAAATKKTPAQILHERSLVMVIDKSASMDTKDCPGGKSRWQWCKQHLEDIYRAENGLLQKEISIITFDSQPRSYANCSPAQLPSVFESTSPDGETNMAPALEDAFQIVRRSLEGGKPALLAIISDGRPTDAEALKKAIINRVNSLKQPKLLSIVFIEVGAPEKYLKELDTELVKQGAAQDVVSVVPLETAHKDGWTNTLSRAVPQEDTVTGGGAGVNKAKEALSAHIYTYDGKSQETTKGKDQVSQTQTVKKQEPVKAHPTGTPAGTPVGTGSGAGQKPQTPAPVVKAHPTGTQAGSGAPAVAQPIEVNEKETVLKRNANKVYK
ncbi:MAG TPA: VWA domain-containing protein [Candidatus Obscuribacter sp.]|nr:VWA domain-containing protein [Candidatus Obscuribacter sp.]